MNNGRMPRRSNTQGDAQGITPHAPNENRQQQNRTSPQGTPQNRPKPRQTVGQRSGQRPSGLKDNLRSQTPLNRQLSKQNAAKAPGTERRKNAPQYFRIKSNKKRKEKRQKHTRSFKRTVTVLGILGYIVLLLLTLLIGGLSLKLAGRLKNDEIRYQLGPDSSVISKKYYPASTLYRSGVYYVDMDSIADYCDLIVTGNEKALRYAVRSTGEEVEFHVGESIAYVNSIPERTGGAAYIFGGRLYIPLEFAKRCFGNLEITLNEERGRITIVRAVNEKEEYLDITLPHKIPHTLDSINFGELEVDIQEQIIAQNQPVPPEIEPPADEGANN